MKKALFIFLAVFAFLLLALIATPLIFKDKIVAAVDKEISQSVNAKVYYDLDNISLSVFKRFPNISATVNEFGIGGLAPFEGDTLMHVKNLQVDINLFSVIFDDYPELTGIHLQGGNIYVKVLEDGTANYDIMVESEETESPDEPSSFRVGVDLIEIEDVNFIYDDRQLQYFLALANFDMVGRGDFTLDVYDLVGQVQADIVKMDYEEVNYLSNKKFTADTQIQVDMEQMKFTFGEGQFGLNDFLFEMDGFLAMPEDDIDFDMTFEGIGNSFKSILSLVPGIYTESFDDLNTSGTMDFSGFLKGTYNDQHFPSFEVALKVTDGMFQYPDLPRPVSDINVDMLVKNETSDLDRTSIDIPVFNLQFGSNPISGRLLLENLITYDMDGQLKGKLNLEELTSIFPIEGMELRGVLDVDAMAKGRYDSVAEIIPVINAKMLLADGYVKSVDYPAPIENLRGNAVITNTSGNMTDFLVDLTSFGFELEGEAIEGKIKLEDFNDLNWDGAVHGTVDLGKLATIFPMEGRIMEGKIRADIDSKGSYADVEAERYNRLDTRGDVEVIDFYYTDADLPQGIRIREAKGDFSPQSVSLTSFDARLGESPVKAQGSLSNYMAYLLEEKAVLKGNLSVSSTHFNINEWMTEGDPAVEDTTELTLIELPKNIDFTMNVNADEVIYDNLIFENAKGMITLKDGILTFKDASMNTLGGQMTLNGAYNTQNIEDPKFNLDFGISRISIQEAFRSFNTVKVFAPIAEHLNGNFTTDFSLSGNLGQDMMPIISSLDGSGLIKVAEAALRDSKILSGITSLTKLKDGNTIQLKNLNITAEIRDGMLAVKPFDVRLWDYQANIQGSTGFDGSINYLVQMQVPAGKFGSQANNLLATLSGTEANENTEIPVAINLSGSYQQPKVNLAGGNSIETLLTNALKSRVSSEKEKVKEELTEQFKAREDSVKQQLREKATVAQDSAKKEASKVVDKAKDKAADEVKNLLKGAFGKKKSTETKPDTTRSEENQEQP